MVEIRKRKARLPTGLSFVGGAVIGALAYSAAAGHVSRLLAPDPEPTRTIAAMPDAPPTAQTAQPGDGVVAEMFFDADEDYQDRWAEVDDALSALVRRVTVLEERLSELGRVSSDESASAILASPGAGMNRDTLVAAGVDAAVAADFLRQQSQIEMQRLELRDQASREGWIGSSRYREELRQLEGNADALREEIGDEAYDRFLYLTGQPNRVTIDSVIEQSPAELAGLQAGDVVLDYADSRIFSFSELRDATRAGERGNYVLVRVQRDGETLELSVPRGPLGVRLDSDQVDPDAGG